MKYSFDSVFSNGVFAPEASMFPASYIAKLWVHLYVVDPDISAELCSGTHLAVEIEDVPIFLITFKGSWLRLQPIGGKGDDMQSWYSKWANDTRVRKVLGCIFIQLQHTGDVGFFKLSPKGD